MNTTVKQVTEVQLGAMTLELDEEKLQKLAELCQGAAETVKNLNEEMERLILMTDNFAGLESEAFPLLRTLCDVKSDYRILMSLRVGRKEAANG